IKQAGRVLRVAVDRMTGAFLQRLDHARRRGEIHVGDPQRRDIGRAELLRAGVELRRVAAVAVDGLVEIEFHGACSILAGGTPSPACRGRVGVGCLGWRAKGQPPPGLPLHAGGGDPVAAYARRRHSVTSDKVCWNLRRVSRITNGTARGSPSRSKYLPRMASRPSSVVKLSPSFLKPPTQSARGVCSASQV